MGKKSKLNKQKLTSAAVMACAAALTVTTVVLAAGPGGGGMGSTSGKIDVAEKSASVITVNLTTPIREDLIKNTEYIGKLESAGSISIYPEASGKITEIYFEAGQQVKAGDLLMKLETADLLFDLEVAQASYNEKVLSANKTLGSDYTSKIISAQNTLDKANRSYRTARQQYATEANVEDNELEKADETRNSAKVSWDEARAAWSKAREDYIAANGGSSEGIDEDPNVIAAHKASTEAYEKYQDADNDYYYLTQQYDDSTSAAAANKDNAYNDITQAKDSLELATGAAYEEQKAVIEASLISAQLSLQKTERSIEKCYVYAPVSGIIESRNASLYETASPNTAAFSISGDSSVQVSFNVSSGGAAALSLGDQVIVSQSGKEYEATIVELEGKADSSTGLFPIKASLSESGGTLLPGVSVKISATTQREINALTLPIDCIYFDDSQPYVFTYSQGKAYRNNLVLGSMSASSAAILSGVSEEDYIITSWHPDLKDKAAVVLSTQASELTGESAVAGMRAVDAENLQSSSIQNDHSKESDSEAPSEQLNPPTPSPQTPMAESNTKEPIAENEPNSLKEQSLDGEPFPITDRQTTEQEGLNK